MGIIKVGKNERLIYMGTKMPYFKTYSPIPLKDLDEYNNFVGKETERFRRENPTLNILVEFGLFKDDVMVDRFELTSLSTSHDIDNTKYSEVVALSCTIY